MRFYLITFSTETQSLTSNGVINECPLEWLDRFDNRVLLFYKEISEDTYNEHKEKTWNDRTYNGNYLATLSD